MVAVSGKAPKRLAATVGTAVTGALRDVAPTVIPQSGWTRTFRSLRLRAANCYRICSFCFANPDSARSEANLLFELRVRDIGARNHKVLRGHPEDLDTEQLEVIGNRE